MSKFIRIGIADKNDNPPYFDKALYEAEVDENEDIQHTVLTVTAKDHDECSYSIIVFRIEITFWKQNCSKQLVTHPLCSTFFYNARGTWSVSLKFVFFFFLASRIRYEITGGNLGGAFAVKNMTGAIYVAGPLDYETRKRVSNKMHYYLSLVSHHTQIVIQLI